MSKPSPKFSATATNCPVAKNLLDSPCKVLNLKACNSCFFYTFLNPARGRAKELPVLLHYERAGLAQLSGPLLSATIRVNIGAWGHVWLYMYIQYIYIYICINLYSHIYYVKQADSECISILGSKGEGKAGSWGCKPNRSWKRAVHALLLCPLKSGTSRFEFLSSEIIWMLPKTHCRRSEAYEIHFFRVLRNV